MEITWWVLLVIRNVKGSVQIKNLIFYVLAIFIKKSPLKDVNTTINPSIRFRMMYSGILRFNKVLSLGIRFYYLLTMDHKLSYNPSSHQRL